MKLFVAARSGHKENFASAWENIAQNSTNSQTEKGNPNAKAESDTEHGNWVVAFAWHMRVGYVAACMAAAAEGAPGGVGRPPRRILVPHCGGVGANLLFLTDIRS